MNALFSNPDMLISVCKFLNETDIDSLYRVNKTLHYNIKADRNYIYSFCQKTHAHRVHVMKSKYDKSTRTEIKSHISSLCNKAHITQPDSLERHLVIQEMVEYLSDHQDFIHYHSSFKMAVREKLVELYMTSTVSSVSHIIMRLYKDLYDTELTIVW